MFVHFENWSSKQYLVDPRIPKSGNIIKAYTSFSDPREALGNDKLFILEFDHSPFHSHEKFAYKNRKGYDGAKLEEDLENAMNLKLRFHPSQELSQVAKQVSRTLIRLGHSEIFPVIKDAMELTNDTGIFFFNHPFSVMHGFEKLGQHPKRDLAVHLDIIANHSFDLLKKLFDWQNEELLLKDREGSKFRKMELEKLGYIEGERRSKEY